MASLTTGSSNVAEVTSMTRIESVRQAERIKIADWLKEEAKIHKASGSRELWQVVYLYSTYVRDGTYATPHRNPTHE